MLIEVSIGDVFDKLSILEIKQQNIKNEHKLYEIEKEIAVLYVVVDESQRQNMLYKLLLYVNQCIWDYTNIIKSMTYEHPDYSKTSFTIFEYNQYRFRLKNMINHKYCTNQNQGNLKEQKSYTETCIQFCINEFTFFRNIFKIFQASCLYDQVIIYYDHLDCNTRFIEHAQGVCNTPNFVWKDIETKDMNDTTCFVLDTWTQNVFNDHNDQERFVPDLGKTVYIGAGMLGDFINSLGVCSVDYWQTGRKCVLYLTDKFGDPFRTGLEQSYEFTKDLVLSQPYICQYEIYNNQNFDVNLALYRSSNLVYKSSWDKIFDSSFQIKGYGKYPWLEVPCNDEYSKLYGDTLLVNYSLNRAPMLSDFNLIRSINHAPIKYLALSDQQADTFFYYSRIILDKVSISTAFDLCQILQSCYCFIGNLSSPLAFATAMHKFCFGLGTNAMIDTIHMQELNVKNYKLLIDQSSFDNDLLKNKK
jgi:hypothetical protein